MKNLAPPLTPEEFARNFAEISPPLAGQAAIIEANRCLFCFDAPCASACPTHIDVPRFIKKIATGNLLGSAFTILEQNVLGLSCARVCPVDVLCEGACVLHRYNKQPIEIGRLQRHAMDAFYAKNPSLPTAAPDNGRSVACIGAGPASLACAAELRRHGYRVAIFERRPLPGGLNTYGVAEYKLRSEDSLKETELIRAMGVEFRLDTEVVTMGNAECGARSDRVTPHSALRTPHCTIEVLEAEYDTIFVGVGLGPTQALRISGEHLPGVVDALRFIADCKAGTATVGRRVTVIGGGNTAIDAATAARRLGAEEVLILYRRRETEMPAFQYEYELARQDNIEFRWLTQPVAICGNEAVEGVECMRMEPGPPDESGRRAPRPVAGSNFVVPCDMVIRSIGQSRLIEFLSACRGIGLANGCVVVDPQTGQTANPKYFAGGDCVNGGREVVDAVAEGKRAAKGIMQGGR